MPIAYMSNQDDAIRKAVCDYVLRAKIRPFADQDDTYDEGRVIRNATAEMVQEVPSPDRLYLYLAEDWAQYMYVSKNGTLYTRDHGGIRKLEQWNADPIFEDGILSSSLRDLVLMRNELFSGSGYRIIELPLDLPQLRRLFGDDLPRPLKEVMFAEQPSRDWAQRSKRPVSPSTRESGQ